MIAVYSVHGTYLLTLECKQRVDLGIGKLGTLAAEPGYYLYVGSAFGPGGVRARVAHHRGISARPHWHIDYLRAVAGLRQAWCRFDERCEHEWASRLMQSGLVDAPLHGFGSSDCGCYAHLFHTRRKPSRAAIERVLGHPLEVVD